MAQVASRGRPEHRHPVALVRGDITELDVDAFVLYAAPDLALGSGFGTAISVRGGPTVQKELETLAPVAPCEAVVSGAGNLKADFIVHAVGPRFQEEDTEGKLRATMQNTLKQAVSRGVRHLAFPAMGAGFYGVPADLSARVMLDEIQKHLEGETTLEEVTVCVLDTPQYRAFQNRLEQEATQ